MLRTEPRVEAVKAQAGEMGIYLARPSGRTGEKRPGLLLMQEIFGVNDHIQDVVRRFAAAGYVVAAPDVFHRTGTWLSFGYDQFAETRPHTSALNEDLVVDDMQAALDFLAAQPDVDPTRIGVVGYCFGGRASLVAAIRMPKMIKAAAIYYGGGIVADAPQAPIHRVGEVRCPVIGFFGAQDGHIPPEAVAKLEAALTEAGVSNEIFCYPYAGHGFCCDARPSYHPRAAQDAWHRTLGFFGAHLGPVPAVEWA
ncbi:MAG TPA: dienelactone hydrolase family protein [Symbiobacteriaceae bacterium]|nr:dienelactone hydrolase family protein [Symbiobacteriaceae bacterium]